MAHRKSRHVHSTRSQGRAARPGRANSATLTTVRAAALDRSAGCILDACTSNNVALQCCNVHTPKHTKEIMYKDMRQMSTSRVTRHCYKYQRNQRCPSPGWCPARHRETQNPDYARQTKYDQYARKRANRAAQKRVSDVQHKVAKFTFR